MAFQREYLMLLPLAAAMAGLTVAPRLDAMWRGAWVGAACALAATIKPTAAIAVLPMAIAVWGEVARSDRARAIAGMALGLALPIGLLAVVMAAWGMALPFWEIATHYYPLYCAITGDNRVVSVAEMNAYRWHETLAYLAETKRWLAFGLVGFLASWRAGEGRPRRLAMLAATLSATFLLYAVLNGRFYDYHWLPFQYFLALVCAPVFGLKLQGWRQAGAVFLSIALSLATIRLSPDIAPQWRLQPPSAPQLARVDAVVALLRPRLAPGDTVQVLDYCNGGIQAALYLGARTATPFIHDFTFYHHVSTPYIQGLRHRFLVAFDGARPRFVIRFNPGQREMWGPDTTDRFEAIEQRLARHYRILQAGPGYRVYERRNQPS